MRVFNSNISMLTGMSLVAAMLLIVPFAAAQDPFGNAPASGQPAEEPAAAAPEADPLDILTGDGLVLQTIRDSKPSTVGELLQAAEAALNLNAFAESKRYLTLLLQKKATPADLAAGHAKTGTGLLIRFSRQPELQPEGSQVADLVLKAASDLARDSKRIDGLVKQLNDDDPGKRRQAIDELELIGIDAAAPMLQVLSQNSLAAQHRNVQIGLLFMFERLRGPIVSALESNKPIVRENVIEVLGESGTKSGMYQLIRPSLLMDAEGEKARTALRQMVGAVPNQREAEIVLKQRINQLLEGYWPEELELNGMVVVWEWDDKANVAKRRLMLPDDAALRMAAILAKDLAEVNHDNPEYVRLALMARLDWEQRSVGWDQPLPAEVLKELASVQQPVLLDMLDEAVKRKFTGAILAALQVLAQTGDASLLHAEQGESLVASLISHTDRRVRMAALQAVVKWKPIDSFNGASRVADSLAFFLSGTGARKVLVGDVRQDQAQTLVGLMGGIGFDAEVFLTPRDIFTAATTQADYEFVLLSDAIDHPPVPELIQRMRRDYRSESLLVGVMGRADTIVKMEQRLRDEPRVEVIPRLHENQRELLYDPNAENLEKAKAAALKEFGALTRRPAKSIAGRMIAMFRENLGRDFVPPEERVSQAFLAADMVTELMELKPSALRDDLGRIEQDLIDNMFRADMTPRLAPIAAEIGSAKVQKALVDLASQESFPVPSRQAAAKAFARAVAKRGTMLTTAQIQTQYDRYNASESSDTQSQQILSDLLDVIEARALRAQANSR